MALNTINHSCGHTQSIEIYGKFEERKNKISWMESQVCPDCFRVSKEQEYQLENDRSANLSNEIGFTALSGSPSQIAWAQSVRQKHLETIISEGTGHPTSGWALMIEFINLEISSSWWIDNRSTPRSSLIKMIAAKYPAEVAELNERGKK